MNMKIDPNNARYFKSIIDGVKIKRTSEVMRKDRGYWYDVKDELNEAVLNDINWEYEYTR